MADEPSTSDVAMYAGAVRAALSHLPAAERDALLEDLEGHLAEVAAESGQPLSERLGPPERYATELIAAYEGQPTARPRRFRRLRTLLSAAASQASGSKTYRAVRAYLPELRPAWWVLRAYLVVLVFAVILRGDQNIRPIPNPLSSGGLVELIAMAVAVVFSIRLGRWSIQRRGGVSWPLRAGNAVAALSGLIALATMSTLPASIAYLSANGGQGGASDVLASGPTTNIYPYTSDGRPLDGVLLYDQDGRAITVQGNGAGVVTQYPTAADGQPITNEYPLAQTNIDGSKVLPPRVAIPPVSPSPSPLASPSPSPSPIK